jgi:hypothetical protein
MFNPEFVNPEFDEDISFEGNDESFSTPTKIEETTFTTPEEEMPSTSGRQHLELTRQKLNDFYTHLGVNNDPNRG